MAQGSHPHPTPPAQRKRGTEDRGWVTGQPFHWEDLLRRKNAKSQEEAEAHYSAARGLGWGLKRKGGAVGRGAGGESEPLPSTTGSSRHSRRTCSIAPNWHQSVDLSGGGHGGCQGPSHCIASPPSCLCSQSFIHTFIHGSTGRRECSDWAAATLHHHHLASHLRALEWSGDAGA